MRLKILGIISFTLIAISLILIRESPATGYELSIYSNAYIIWILLISSNIIGTIIIINQVFSKNKNFNRWLLGFSILIFTNFIILTLGAMRGYWLYNFGDSIEHYHISLKIFEKGYFEGDNTYPITHILINEISDICKLSIVRVMRFLPAIFSVLFIVFILLLSKLLLQDYRKILLASILSNVFFFSYYHVAVYPAGFSVLMLPLVFYLYFKYSNLRNLDINRNLDTNRLYSNFKLLLLIFVILYPFFHPSTTMILIFFILFLELIRGKYTKDISLKPAIISSIIFILWNQRFYFFDNSVKSIFSIFQGKDEKGYFMSEGTQAVQNVHGMDFIKLFLKMYGFHMIFFLLSLIATILIIKKMLKKRDIITVNMSVLSMFLLGGIPLNYLLFVSTKSISVGRLLGLNYSIVVTPILSAFTLHEMIKNFNSKKSIILISMILTFMIGFIFVASLLNIYRSPWILQENWQVTHSYSSGLEWFSTKSNSNILSNGMGFYQVNNPAYLRYGSYAGIIPPHFNYSNFKTFGEQFHLKKYVVITQMSKLANANDILANTRMDPIIQWGFNEKDFDQFENHDLTVNRLYTNGEFWIYYVNQNKEFIE